MLNGGAEMVVKGGKKEMASLGWSGKRKKMEKGGKEERKWRYNQSVNGKRRKEKQESLGP